MPVVTRLRLFEEGASGTFTTRIEDCRDKVLRGLDGVVLW